MSFSLFLHKYIGFTFEISKQILPFCVTLSLTSAFLMDLARDGKIQGQWALKKAKELPCILPCPWYKRSLIKIFWCFFFRLTKKKIAKCILATFLDYQDLTRDTFLLAKIIASAGGWYILSNSENAFVLLVSYCLVSLSGHFIIILNWTIQRGKLLKVI